MTEEDSVPSFWQHQLTRGRRPTPRAREQFLRDRKNMTEDERIRVTTDPAAVVRALKPWALKRTEDA